MKARSPATGANFYPFLFGGAVFLAKVDCRQKRGTLILTSLLEDLVMAIWPRIFGLDLPLIEFFCGFSEWDPQKVKLLAEGSTASQVW